MTPLLELLGKNMASPEAIDVLERYPALEPETHAELEEGLHYLRSESDGLLIKLSETGEVLTIFLMAEGKEGFSQFAGPLPAGLSFGSTRREVVMALGAPAFIRPPGKVGSFMLGELMRFDKPGYSIHVQFRSSGAGIELVTAVLAHLVPGRSVAPLDE